MNILGRLNRLEAQSPRGVESLSDAELKAEIAALLAALRLDHNVPPEVPDDEVIAMLDADLAQCRGRGD